MRKFTLLTAVFALFATAASADTKVIYQDNYADKTTSMANWTDNRSNGAIDFINTPDGNYMQFNLTLNGNNFNGTRFSSIWGSTPWEGITLPETGYKYEVSFNFETFGNDSKNAAQRNHEIAIISVTESEDQEAATINEVLANYWGTAGSTNVTINAGKENEKQIDVFPNYLFKLSQTKTGEAAGEGGYVGNGMCGFTINNETEEVKVAQGTWYKLTLEVVGQTVKYDITDISGTPLKAGSYTLPEGADNRAGGMIVYGARYASKTNVGLGLKITCESDEAVANEPIVALSQVKGNDRVYKVTFAEGETLHYVLPGAEEQTLDYWDAEDEAGNPGVAMLTATQSGTLQAWTTKDVAVSQKVNVEVTAGWIKLVDPVVAISNVSEGFGKSFTVTFNASAPEHLLPVNAAITYTIDGGAEQEVAPGGTITMDKAGTLVVTVNQIPQGGQEWYKRSCVTYNNDVEYAIATTSNFVFTPAELASNTDLEAPTALGNSGRSQWERVYQMPGADGGALEGRNAWGLWNGTDDKVCDIYKIKLDALDKVLDPLRVADTERTEDRNNYYLFPYEGIVYYSTAKGNNHIISIDPKYVTDDAAKPNFYVLNVTVSYDRPDKAAESVFQTHVIKTDATYSQYRFDNAISKVQVLTYKGFVPGSTGIEAITTVKEADKNAPIYTIGGVQVKDASQKGIYIQNGKKFVVK
ncbi:MAG: hypothetical protein IJV38_13595 [Prevotella sp.]|nr:hypothetical protein [Prevotella sp.]